MTQTFDTLPLDRKEFIDSVCREFEDTRFDDVPPPLTVFVEKTPFELREETLRELLAIDFEMRLSDGREIPVDQYLGDFPNFGRLINEVYEDVVSNLSGISREAARTSNEEARRLGDYRIVREVGRGGMGFVYEAVQESLKRTVALKVLPPNPLSDGAGEKRFERESVAIARLHHSHIVDVFGRGEHDGVMYFAMRFVDGVGLNVLVEQAQQARALVGHDRLQGSTEREPAAAALTRDDATVILIKRLDDESSHPTRAEVPPRTARPRGSVSSQPASDVFLATANETSLGQAETGAVPRNEGRLLGGIEERSRFVARIGSEIADALAYAHQQGVLHRDVKPSNILVDNDGASWLTDFGLAKLFTGEGDANLTEYGDVVGTLRYMAPEVLRGQVDERSDVFGLGLTLYELLALRPAYQNSQRQALLQDVLNADVPPLTSLAADAPRDLVTIIQKAVDREPQTRYQSARELADDLQRFLNDEPIHARPITLLERWKRWSRRNRALSVALVCVAFLLVAMAMGSSIVAGHFRSLSSSLSNTVSELNTANLELKKTTDKATHAEAAAVQSAKDADAARRGAQETLADMQVERGVQSFLQKEPVTAALWFTGAAEYSAHDPHRETVNRLRARNALLASPQTKAVWQMAPPTVEIEKVYSSFRQLEYSPQGRHLWALHYRFALLFDLDRRERVSWFDELERVNSLCWSADGRRVFIGLETGEVQIRDLGTGALLRTLKGSTGAGPLAVTHDGRFLAGGKYAVQLWSLSGEPRVVHEWPANTAVDHISFNRSGTRVLTHHFSEGLRVFSTLDGERSEKSLFPKQPYNARTAALLNDGRQLVAISPQRKVIGWRDVDTDTDATPPGVQRQFNNLNCLAVHPDEKSFAVGTGDGCHWFSIGGDNSYIPINEPVTALGFSSDGRSLWTASPQGILRQWSVGPMPELLSRHTHWDAPTRLAVSPDGTEITVGDTRRVTVRQVPNQSFIERQFVGWGDIHWVARLRQGSTLISRGAHRVASPNTPRSIQLDSVSALDLETGRVVGTPIKTKAVTDTCLLNDGRAIAVIDWVEPSKPSEGSHLMLFEIESGQQRGQAWKPAASPWAITTRNGTDKFIVQLTDNSVHEVDSQTGQPVRSLNLTCRRELSQFLMNHGRVECSPDGKTIVAVAADSTVAVIDAETFQPRFAEIRPALRRGNCRCIAFSRDSRLLATAVDHQNAVQVWNLATGQAVCDPLPHPGDVAGIKSIAFSPDGRLIASANQDGQARQWNWKDGQLACPPTRHMGEVVSVLYSTDGRFLITAARPGVIQIADTKTGKLIAAPIELPDPDPYDSLQLEWVKGKLLVSAKNTLLLDVSSLLVPVSESLPALKADAEVRSARRLEFGELRSFNGNEWYAHWLKQKPASSRLVADSQMFEESAYLRQAEELLRSDSTEWHPLNIRTATSDAGATLTVQADGSLLVSGVNQLGDRYVVSGEVGTEPIASLRLEVLPDASLPSGGSGRHASGNFQLKELRAFATGPNAIGPQPRNTTDIQSVAPIDGLEGRRTRTRTPHTNDTREGPKADSLQRSLPLSDVSASFCFAAAFAVDVDVRGTIRDDLDTVWHVFGRTREAHHTLFTVAPASSLKTGQQLAIELQHHGSGEPVNLGRFRLSVSSDPHAVFRQQFLQTLRLTRVSGPMLLALAQWASGKPRQAIQTVNETPLDNEPNNIGTRFFVLANAYHEIGETSQAQRHLEQLRSFLQQRAFPEQLRAKLVDTLVLIGGRTVNEARAEILSFELTREVERLNAISSDDLDAALVKSQLTLLNARLRRWSEIAAQLDEPNLNAANRTLAEFLDAACYSLMAGDSKRYEQIRLAAVEAESQVKTAARLVVLSQIVLLNPDSMNRHGTVLETLHRLSDSEAPAFGPKWWAAALSALDAVRLKQPKAAADHLAKIPNEAPRELQALSQIIRAMIERELDHHENAAELLTAAHGLLPFGLSDSIRASTPIAVSAEAVRSEWLFVELIRREAQSRLRPSAP